MAMPKKTEERIRSALKRFVPVLLAQRDRDVSEADTVTLVRDFFSDLLGFDKYAELTSEHQVRSLNPLHIEHGAAYALPVAHCHLPMGLHLPSTLTRR